MAVVMTTPPTRTNYDAHEGRTREKPRNVIARLLLFHSFFRLLTQTEGLNQFTIASDVLVVQVLQ